MKRIILSLTLMVTTSLFAQQGGMWLPNELTAQNVKELESLGLKIPSGDIYNKLKDAAPQFNGGCSSGVISNQGLLITNHHCGYEQIQKHSSLENNYLEDGFVAKELSEELPNPGVKVSFVVRMTDVTSQVLAGVEQLSGKDRLKLIEENKQKIVNNSPKEPWQENQIKSYYADNKFVLFVMEHYKDIRLVMAPPSSIGKFGADTDNWVYPRHTGDFMFFRIYADKNNRPAEYSPENVPYKPKHFFKVSVKGVKENDFTMVLGYPGRTQEYLPAVAIKALKEEINPTRIHIREEILKIQEEEMKNNPAVKIQYASKNARIANYWKKWKGENLGLTKQNVVEKKQQEEALFLQKITEKGTKQEKEIIPKFKELYREFTPYDKAYNIFAEVVQRNSDILSLAFRVNQLKNIYSTRGEQSFLDRQKRLLQSLESFYKNYDKEVDRKIFEKAISLYIKHMPEQFCSAQLKNINIEKLSDKIYSTSAFISKEKLTHLLKGKATEVIENIKSDPLIDFFTILSDTFNEKVIHSYYNLSDQIDELQSQYTKAILKYADKNSRIFPDANSSLRVTYGKVKGYSPADGVYYTPNTYLDGVMEKYIPNDYEFDVPKRLRELIRTKNYGSYTDSSGKLPVCYIGTNHTTGGNSGSPALDAKGNLVGLNFDRVWEGTMSDIFYSPEICRNVMVDMRYVLFITDKYFEAEQLIKEINPVR